MEYFLINIDWDENLELPWDTLWHHGPYGALDCLGGSLPLAAIWKAPLVTIERGSKRPDIYDFNHNYAVTQQVRDLLSPIVREEAEFLPLAVPKVGPLFVIHPLWPVDFDEHAVVNCNEVSGNITVVKKYSFNLDPDKYNGPRHLFRMKQAKGSAARDHGFTLKSVIVSEEIKRVCENNLLTGITFRKVQLSEKT